MPPLMQKAKCDQHKWSTSRITFELNGTGNYDLSEAMWWTSSYSSANGQCVEVADSFTGIVPVRDSKNPEGPCLIVGADALAFLRDRTLVNEGRKQIYGTQIAGVKDGTPVPWPCEEPERMNELRAEVGIEPFDEYVAKFSMA